jgi:hypothetical protein
VKTLNNLWRGAKQLPPPQTPVHVGRSKRIITLRATNEVNHVAYEVLESPRAKYIVQKMTGSICKKTQEGHAEIGKESSIYLEELHVKPCYNISDDKSRFECIILRDFISDAKIFDRCLRGALEESLRRSFYMRSRVSYQPK